MRDETAFFSLQKAGRLSSASLLTLFLVSGSMPGAQAQERYYYIQQGQYQRFQGPPPRIENRRDARGRPNARPTAQAPKQAPKQAPSLGNQAHFVAIHPINADAEADNARFVITSRNVVRRLRMP